MFKQLTKNYFGYLKLLNDIHYIILKYGRDKVNKRKKDRLVQYILNMMEEKIETELSVEKDELIKSDKMYFQKKKEKIESLENLKNEWVIKTEDSVTCEEIKGIQNDIDLFSVKKIKDVETKKEVESILNEKIIKSGNDSVFNELSTFDNSKSVLIQGCNDFNVDLITDKNSKDLGNNNKNDSVSLGVQDSVVKENLSCTAVKKTKKKRRRRNQNYEDFKEIKLFAYEIKPEEEQQKEDVKVEEKSEVKEEIKVNIENQVSNSNKNKRSKNSRYKKQLQEEKLEQKRIEIQNEQSKILNEKQKSEDNRKKICLVLNITENEYDEYVKKITYTNKQAKTFKSLDPHEIICKILTYMNLVEKKKFTVEEENDRLELIKKYFY